MAKVHVCNAVVQGNPSTFMSKLEFEITFECLEDLPEDLEWKIIYVGSAESEEYDQVLDTVYVGPVPEGRHKFVFSADPPNPEKIPDSDIVGVTVLLITCSYRSQEFIRVGYYVNNDYEDPELQENPPSPPKFDLLKRNILASSPRVTKFKINWDGAGGAAASAVDGDEEVPADAAMDGDVAGTSAMVASSNLENEPPQMNRPPARMKDPMLASPLKTGLLNDNSSSLNAPIPSGMDIDM